MLCQQSLKKNVLSMSTSDKNVRSTAAILSPAIYSALLNYIKNVLVSNGNIFVIRQRRKVYKHEFISGKRVAKPGPGKPIVHGFDPVIGIQSRKSITTRNVA